MTVPRDFKRKGGVVVLPSLWFLYTSWLRDSDSKNLSKQREKQRRRTFWPRLSDEKLSSPPWEGKNRHRESLGTATTDRNRRQHDSRAINVLHLFSVAFVSTVLEHWPDKSRGWTIVWKVMIWLVWEYKNRHVMSGKKERWRIFLIYIPEFLCQRLDSVISHVI